MIVTSYSSEISQVEKCKGYLYKIRNNENQTVGYLFGSLHKIKKENGKLPPLHDKIFKCLARCKTLWLELNLFDEKTLIEHYFNKQSHGALLFLLFPSYYKEFIRYKKQHPRGTEDLLAFKAEELGLKIESLETEKSRKTAHDTILKELKPLNLLQKFLPGCFMAISTLYLEKILKKFETGNFSENNEEITMGLKFLFLAVTTYASISPCKDSIVQLIGRYDCYFKSNIFITSLTALLILGFIAQEQKGKCLREAVRAKWKANDPTLEELQIADMNPLRSKMHELDKKELHVRDVFMARRIHKALLSSKGERHFIAVGAGHLLHNYENLKWILEGKGWKFIDVYSKK